MICSYVTLLQVLYSLKFLAMENFDEFLIQIYLSNDSERFDECLACVLHPVLVLYNDVFF